MQAACGLSCGFRNPPQQIRCCSQQPQPKDGKQQQQQQFLDKVPWDCGVVASTMISYFGGFHYPLSYSGLSIVAKLLHEESLEPQLKAVSLLLLQSAELYGAVWLIESSIKPFGTNNSLELELSELFRRRSIWILALVIASTSILLVAARPALSGLMSNNSYEAELKELLNGSDAAVCVTVVVFSGITPLLEEVVYRQFLLRSLATYMPFPWAIVSSSLVFSLAHIDYLQSLPATAFIFSIGCVLGTSYATSAGDLAVPLAVHSLYNLIIVVVTFVSS